MVSLQNFLQLEDFNGVPLAAGKVYVYHQGRTELAEIYSDINGETPIANPAILDDLGMQNIYVSNVYNYTVVVTDPYNNELFTREIYPNGVDGDGNNRLYEGLDPICVNNEKLVISAKKATLSVQDPLYFVEDSPSAVCIGLQESAYSGLPYVENSALGYGMAGMQPYVSSISGLGLYALSAGSATLADSASISYSAENAGLVTSGWETGSDGRITAYNGTAFSAGKVYSGVSPVWVNNDTDQIGVSSKDFLANSPLYFTEYSDRVELSISGLPPTPGLMYESGFNYESGKITGYNNSGISAGKVYSGISPITVDNVNDTISVASATLGVQAPLFFVEDSESATVIGLNTAQIHVDIPESANWNEVYSTVNNNSGSWTSAADELAVLNTAKWEEASNALSSNSADWNSVNDKLDKSALELTGEYVSGIELGGTSYRLYAGWSTEASISQTANFDSEGNYIVEYVNAIKNNSGDWNNVSAKLDSTASANFLTTADSSEFYPMTGNPSGFLTAETDWTNTITAASAYAYSEATALIPTALTGDYIETSAIKSAQIVDSAFITGFYDGQISATFAGEANRAYSARKADSASAAGSAYSAAYVYSGWGANPTLYHTDAVIKQYYAVTGSTQGFPAGNLYKFNAYSADSAYEAGSAEKARNDILGRDIATTYQTINGMTGYLRTGDSSNFYSTANESGFITGVDLTDYATKDFVNDNVASSISGKLDIATYSSESANFLTAHQSLTASANWNSTYDTVSNNSATWGQGGGGVVIPYAGGDPEAMYTAIAAAWDGSTPVYLSYTQNDKTYIVQVIDFVDGLGQMESYFEFASVQNYYDGQGKLRMIMGMVKYNPNYLTNKYDCSWSTRDVAAASYPTYSDTGKVLTVNEFGYPAWQTPQGGALPQSASDAIDVVTGGSANWNSTTATVNANSGAWGGSGIELSAGFGIDIQLVDNKLVISLATATGAI